MFQEDCRSAEYPRNVWLKDNKQEKGEISRSGSQRGRIKGGSYVPADFWSVL